MISRVIEKNKVLVTLKKLSIAEVYGMKLKNLNESEMNQLLREMEKTPNSGQCNHGRPTSISLSLKDIEKLFNRT